MAVSTTTATKQYSGDGSTVSFPTVFAFLANADIQITHRDSSGTETVWVENTQYTLTGAEVSSGGTVTVDTSPTDYTPASGETITIERITAETQGTEYPEGGAFPAKAHETALDRATMLVQQATAKIARTLKYPVTDASTLSAEIPNSDDRADTMLGFDSNGEPKVVADASDSAAAAAVSATAAAVSAAAAANSAKTVFMIAVTGETATLTTGTAKITFRMPFALTLTDVRASLDTVSSSGIPTVDINEGGSTILSTKLTIDASEKTSTTADAAVVISDTALADDAEMTIDVDVAGTGAKGLKVYLIGDPA